MQSIRQGFMLGLGLSFESSVEWATDVGYEFVEVLLDGPYARERVKNVKKKRDILDETGVGVVIHLPFAADIGSPFTPVRQGAIEECRRGMDLAATLGADRVVFHPSSDAWSTGWDVSECLPFIHESVRELIDAAHERDLTPCLENIITGYYDVHAFPELLDRFPGAQMTFDTSHALLAGMDESAMAAFIERHADRIGHFHLVDTRGEDDEHLPIGMGSIAFETILNGIRRADWHGTATHEVGTENKATIALSKQNLDSLQEVR